MPRPRRSTAWGWEDCEGERQKVMDITGLDPRYSGIAVEIMNQLVREGETYEAALRSVFPVTDSYLIRYKDWMVDDIIGLCPEGYMHCLWIYAPSIIVAQSLRSQSIPEISKGQWEVVRMVIPPDLDIKELHESVMDRMRNQDPDAEVVWNFDVVMDDQGQRALDMRIWVDWDWLDKVWIASLPWWDVCCVHYDKDRQTAIENLKDSINCYVACASEYGNDLMRDCCALFEEDRLFRITGDRVEYFCEQAANWEELEAEENNLLVYSHSQVLNMLLRSGWKVRRFGEKQVVLYNLESNNWRSKGWMVFPIHDEPLPYAIQCNVFGFYRSILYDEYLHDERPRIRSDEEYHDVQTIGSWVNHEGTLYKNVTIQWTDNGATCWWIRDWYYPPSVARWIGDYDILEFPDTEVPRFFEIFVTEEGAKRLVPILEAHQNGSVTHSMGGTYSLDYRYELREREQAVHNKTAGVCMLKMEYAEEPYVLYGYYDLADAIPVAHDTIESENAFNGKMATDIRPMFRSEP